MSDQTDTADAEVETTDSAAEGATGTEDTTPPWGDDFDPARAWNTIQQQREAERAAKEEADRLRQDAEFAQSLRSDPAALQAFLEEQGYEFEADDDDYEDDDEGSEESVNPAVIQQLVAAEQARQQRENAAQFEKDFKALLGDREVDDEARDWIVRAAQGTGTFDHDSLKQAVEAFFKFTAPAPKKPRAPHVPGGGPPADPEAPNTHSDRVQRAMARMQAEQA